MKDWIKITGLEANRLAGNAGIARPGTFNAIVLKWAGSGSAPSFVELKGRLQCMSCNHSTVFALDSMSDDVPCAGCRVTYSLFKEELRVGDARGIVVLATVLSRAATGASSPPQIEVTDIRSNGGDRQSCQAMEAQSTQTERKSDRSNETGSYAVTAFSAAEAESLWRSSQPPGTDQKVVRSIDCNSWPNKGFFGFGRKPGKWVINWEVSNSPSQTPTKRDLVSAPPDEQPPARRPCGFECGDTQLLKAYLDAGGDINSRDSRTEWTLLHQAAFHGDVEAVLNLLKAGADPTLPAVPGSRERTIDVLRSNYASFDSGSSESDKSQASSIAEILKLLKAAERRQ